MSGGDDLLIVIPCLNEAAHLPPLLEQFTTENAGALIVVADGGSTDGSRAVVQDRSRSNPNVLLLDNPKRLQAAGVNLAVWRHGGGRHWLLRVDAHCAYPKGFVDLLLAAAEEHRADSVVVPLVSEGIGCFQIAAAAAQNSVLGTGGSPHRHVGRGRFVDHGHHALMRIAAFSAAGGYVANMIANEDAELDRRLTANGARIWLEPGAAVTYFPRSRPLDLWRQYYRYGRGRMRTLRLHGGRPKLRQILPLVVPPAILLAILAPLAWWLALPFALWLVGTLAAGAWMGVRAKRACALLSGAAAMIMHAAWGFGALRELASWQPLARPNS
jgi:succinoglycan biosynthesis protein ExoA